MSDSPPTANPPATRSAVLVAFMWGGYFLNYCCRQSVFAIFPALKADLGFTDTQLGLLGSVFLWVYCLFGPAAGTLGDRFPKRRLVVISLVAWSVATALTGFGSTAGGLIVLRAVFAVAEVLFMPAAMALTANAFPAIHRSRALAVLMTAQIAGTMVGSWVGGYLAQAGHWRWAFFIFAGSGLVYALPYAQYLRRFSEPAFDRAASVPRRRAFQVLAANPTFLLLAFTTTVFGFGLWFIYGWLQVFLHEKFGLSLSAASFNATIYLQGATLVGLLSGGVLADALFRRTTAARLWVYTGGLLLCAPCLHELGACSSLETFRIAATGFGLFSGFLIGNIFSTVFDVVPANIKATAVGVVNFCGIGSGFAPWVGGLSRKTIGMEAMFTIVAASFVLCGLLLLVAIKSIFPRDFTKAHPRAIPVAVG